MDRKSNILKEKLLKNNNTPIKCPMCGHLIAEIYPKSIFPDSIELPPFNLSIKCFMCKFSINVGNLHDLEE